MLSRPGVLAVGQGWSVEVKWEGFRAIVSTEDGLRVRSRCGWNMTSALSELRDLPAGLLFDGELVAWRDGEPFFPLVCRRVLMGDRSVAFTYIVFDVLAIDSEDVTGEPFCERRRRLEPSDSKGQPGRQPRLRRRSRALGDGVRARPGWRRREENVEPLSAGRARLGEVKNPRYWRRDAEREAIARKRERRSRTCA
jgi:ATP dependent DNA ligase domain